MTQELRLIVQVHYWYRLYTAAYCQKESGGTNDQVDRDHNSPSTGTRSISGSEIDIVHVIITKIVSRMEIHIIQGFSDGGVREKKEAVRCSCVCKEVQKEERNTQHSQSYWQFASLNVIIVWLHSRPCAHMNYGRISCPAKTHYSRYHQQSTSLNLISSCGDIVGQLRSRP